MWQQPQSQGIPFQQGQYNSYAYNAQPQQPQQPQQQQQHQQQQQQQQQQNYIPSIEPIANINEAAIDASFKRQADGPILWFAGPPLNVVPEKEPVHSIAYLHWKNANK